MTSRFFRWLLARFATSATNLQQSHAMLHFDAWFANQGATDDSVREEAAAELARRVEAVV